MSFPLHGSEHLADDNQPNSHTEEESSPSPSGNSRLSNMSTSLVAVENTDRNDTTRTAQELRQPNNLQELLNLSTMLQSSSGQEDAVSTNTMDKKRDAFLREALAHLSVDVVAEMQVQVGILAEIRDQCSARDLSRYEATLETISYQTCCLDMANLFYQIGGRDAIVPLLRHPLPQIRWRAADVIAECCRNNPFCQTLSVTEDLIRPLIEIASSDSDIYCQFKAISAVSAIVRDNPEGIKQFRKFNGLNMVNKALNSARENIIAKTAYLIMALCDTDPTMKDELLQTPIIESLVSLIRLSGKFLAEHLLKALLALIRQHDSAIKECLRNELGLYEHIDQSISLNSHDETFQAHHCMKCYVLKDYVTCGKEILQILNDYKARN